MFKKPKEAKSIENLYQSAYWHLAKRDMSIYEIRKKLLAKTQNMEWVESVINDLIEKNYINEERFVEGFIRSSGQNSRHGPNKIRQNLLYIKGVSNREMISNKFAESECDFFEIAKELLEKKFGVEELDYKKKGKAYAYLSSRGFEKDQITYALECQN